MALLDLLGRRWTLRVLWELRDGSATFRELRDRCDRVSPTVLNRRLFELREAGVVELTPGSGFQCTRSGLELLHAIARLDSWAKAWARRMGSSLASDARATAASRKRRVPGQRA